jgi:hypothetical protein
MAVMQLRSFWSLPFVAALALVPLLGLLVGCSDLRNCPAAKPDLVIETGVTNNEARTYQSASPSGPRDPFPAMTTLHFAHHLGFTPEIRQSFVSFSAENSGSSENAGNQGEWLCVDDYEFVIKNATCQDFYIEVSAYGSGAQHAPCKCKERNADGNCP